MATQTWEATAHDTLTPISAQLQQKDSTGTLTNVDLTGMTVKFKMVNSTGGAVVAETATGVTVTSAANGRVQFDFSAAHVTRPGTYWGWFVVYSGSESTTFPQGRGLKIVIHEDE